MAVSQYSFLKMLKDSLQEHQHVPSQTGPIYHDYVEAAVHSGEEVIWPNIILPDCLCSSDDSLNSLFTRQGKKIWKGLVAICSFQRIPRCAS